MKSNALEKEALELPVAKRAKLAQRLLASLEELSEGEAEKLWLDEASRRAREIDAGRVKLVTATELERRVRARLK
ncbi:MAG: addiction module protein [Proteobacteria bacterium]|nr:addiction module protein [Pseudomonadota bacterium]